MRILSLAFLATSLYAQPALQGLGASTYTCVDRDGDGYGRPGCTGPDADDTDSTLHTGAQGVTKYGTLTTFLSRLGYTPAHIYYLATAAGPSAASARKRALVSQ